MRTEQLEYFAAVARWGSFRRAATELHLSQPALSESVRNLERELGVDLLDRRRSGATIGDAGRDLLPHVHSVLEAVDRLRHAASDENEIRRVIRLGTVNAATSPLVTPTIREFRATHPSTQVEVVSAQQEQIHRGLLDGAIDLGLVNYLGDDDMPPEFHSTELIRGRAVVCVRTDSALAAKPTLRRADLIDEPLVMMRPGYVMHRYVHRLLDGRVPSAPYSTDGAEMGKLMVAEGLGATVLPDYSVIGDPLERQGTITYREIEDDSTPLLLVIQQRRSGSTPRAVRDLHQLFVDHALRVWPLRLARASSPDAG
jgi:DNA-binding transcriptional LysR family regulator